MLLRNANLRVLCVNGRAFFEICDALKKYQLSVLLNDQYIKIASFTKVPRNRDSIVEFLIKNCTDILDSSSANRVLNELIRSGFLRHCDEKYISEQNWCKYNWQEALQFHIYTNNIKKVMYNNKIGPRKDVAQMKQYVKKEKPPSNYKEYDSVSFLLKKPDLDESYKVSSVLCSKSKKRSLTFQLLSRMFYYAFGETGERYMQVTGRHVKKTVPSGGARHPIEVYVLINGNIGKVKAGIYHYNVKKRVNHIVCVFNNFLQLNHILYLHIKFQIGLKPEANF